MTLDELAKEVSKLCSQKFVNGRKIKSICVSQKTVTLVQSQNSSDYFYKTGKDALIPDIKIEFYEDASGEVLGTFRIGEGTE